MTDMDQDAIEHMCKFLGYRDVSRLKITCIHLNSNIDRSLIIRKRRDYIFGKVLRELFERTRHIRHRNSFHTSGLCLYCYESDRSERICMHCYKNLSCKNKTKYCSERCRRMAASLRYISIRRSLEQPSEISARSICGKHGTFIDTPGDKIHILSATDMGKTAKLIKF